MDRRIVARLSIIIAVCAPACSTQERSAQSVTPDADGWVATPIIETVERGASSLTVRGRAEPLGRVVLRGEESSAYAASADDSGRFQIRIRSPATDSLMSVEAQTGQLAVPASYRLLVSADSDGPIALVSAGVPTVRLDVARGLDVIDGDGRARVASGRASPGTVVAIATPGSPSRALRTGPDGRWTVTLHTSDGISNELSVNGRRYEEPARGQGADATGLVRTPTGWHLTWRLSPTATRTSWFPAAGASTPS